MSIEKVRAYFAPFGMENRILEFPVSSATVELAALALNTEPCRIAKTLSFSVKEDVVLIVTAGDAKVNSGKFKSFFGVKAKMLSREEAEEKIGHAVGGVCPFAVKEGVKVYLDESLKRFETVFPACGSSNSAIELTIPELETYSCFTAWVDVCSQWQT
jgi:prolyl-tRNA editing enzyme YbaK/EbsC (Cys-tRNA(Pro) deacylase)